VTIIERRAELGAGVAYATNHPDHLLNVRASNMSAFPDDPGHFVCWLAARQSAHSYGPDDFAPRHLYRDYLSSLLVPLLADGRLRHVRVEAIAVREIAGGLALPAGSGRRCAAISSSSRRVTKGQACPRNHGALKDGAVTTVLRR
jgi:uncharacterized NAD(P)/FAD-binding protein YdhS